MGNKKKALFFIKCNAGGAERVTINIADMLPKDEFDVVFVIVGRNNEIYKFIPKEYRTHRIKYREYRLLGIGRIIYWILKEKADIVFSSMMYINVRVILAAKICGVKSIVRNNNTIFSDSVNVFLRYFMTKTYPLANHIIAQQDEMKDEIVEQLNVPSDKVVSLQNPLKKETILKLSESPSPYENNGCINYLTVGRFANAKGQDILIQAFHKIHARNNNAHLFFVGGYSEGEKTYEFVTQYIRENNLSDCVHIIGLQDNPYKWMKYCTCYVMPSRLEGLPNSLIEAMFLNKPVVGTLCIPMVSRIIKDGYNGIIVPSEDVDGIAEGMIKALGLNNFEMTYTPSTNDDFINLFR